MKYYIELPDGRLRLISRTTYWRVCRTRSGITRMDLDSSGRLSGWIFCPEPS